MDAGLLIANIMDVAWSHEGVITSQQQREAERLAVILKGFTVEEVVKIIMSGLPREEEDH